MKTGYFPAGVFFKKLPTRLSSATESRGLLTTTTSTAHVDGNWTETTTGPDGTKQVRNYVDGLLSEAISYAANSTTPLQMTTFGYNDLGQMTTQTDRQAGSGNLTTTMTYFLSGQLRSVITPYDTANNTGGTVYTRDVLGRETSLRFPDGSIKNTEYNDSIGSTKVSGSQTYPSETTLNAFGQVVSLKTWQNYGSGNQGAATTTWSYDLSSGLLSGKRYEGNKGPNYTYDAAGRLRTRTWARGTTTTYSYSTAGDLDGVDYSDITPDVTFGYDRNGNGKFARTNTGNITYTINPTTLLYDSKTTPVGGENRTMTWTRDGLLRDNGFELTNGGTTEVATAWTFDSAGRPFTVTGRSAGAADQTFTYQWVGGRPQLIETVSGPAHTVVNAYEPLRDVLTSKTNKTSSGGSVISGYTYAVNSLGQRTSVQQTGSAFGASAFNLYGYDGMGQVTTANRFQAGTLTAPEEPVANQQFTFGYDTIGNRKTATNGVAGTTYTANPVNQYTAINTASPTYDDDGNILADGSRTYTWDGENRLIKVVMANGDESTYS